MDVNWKKTKPKPKGEFILITASFFAGRWDYSLFTVVKQECDGAWYYGLFCEDGDEWGDYSDLKATWYLTMPLLRAKKQKASS